MSGPIEIASNERGVVRLFAIDLEEREIEAFAGQVFGAKNGTHDWPLRDALGATYLDHEYVEVVRMKDIASIGLSGYLTEGIGLPAEALAEDKERLDDMTGHVLIVLSRAFDGVAQTLTPKAPLRAVATYQDPGVTPSYDPIHADAAKGHLETADSSPDVGSGRRGSAAPIALLALGLAAIIILALTFGGFG